MSEEKLREVLKMLRVLRDIIQKYSNESTVNYCYNEVSETGVIRLMNCEDDLNEELSKKQLFNMTFERNLYKNDLIRMRERYKDLVKENKDLLFKLENIHSSLLRYEQEVEDYKTINLELRDELKRQLEVSKLLAESNQRLREELEETQEKSNNTVLWQVERRVDK